jgi:hypothetical protein
LPDGDRVIVYRQQYFAFFTLLEHMELTLSLEGKARRKALAKTRRLQQELPGSAADRPAGWLLSAAASADRATRPAGRGPRLGGLPRVAARRRGLAYV